MVRGAAAESSQSGQIRERGIRVFQPEFQHLAQRVRELLRIKAGERFLLTRGRPCRTPGVGRVEVGDPIRVRLRLTEYGPRLIVQNRVVKPHLREQSRYPVGALGVGKPALPATDDLERGARDLRDAPDELFFPMDKLKVVAAARPGDGARALKSTPEVSRPVGFTPRVSDNPQLFSDVDDSAILDPYLVAMTPKAIRLYRGEPRLQPKLSPPEANHRPRYCGAMGVEFYAAGIQACSSVDQAGQLGAARAPGA